MALYIGNKRCCTVIEKMNPLPYDTEVAYLESNGTQYIDTGIYVNGASTVLKMRYSGFPNKYFTCGCRTSSSQDAFVFSNGGTMWTAYTKYFLNYNDSYNGVIDCPNDDEIHSVIMDNSVTVDSTTLVTFERSNFTSDKTIWLFGANSADGAKYGYMRIYSCLIYDGNNLIMDLIPVRVGQVGFMYDKVSKNLLYNRGTGDFILGYDIT